MTTQTGSQTRKIEVVQQGNVWLARRAAVPTGHEYMTDGAAGRPVIGVRRGEAREYSSESEARQAVARLLAAPSYDEKLASIARRLEAQAHPLR